MRINELIFASFTILVGFFIMFQVLVSGGQITIQKDYYEDLKNCEAKLEQEVNVCPVCQCNFGISSIVWGILGLLFYGGGLLFFSTKSKELKKREDDIKEEEIKWMKKRKK